MSKKKNIPYDALYEWEIQDEINRGLRTERGIPVKDYEKKKRNKFAGANSIWITKRNQIAVKKVSTHRDKSGSFRLNEVTRYYKPTKANIDEAKRLFGSLLYKR